MPKTSHQLARELLELPDLPVGVNHDGEYNAAPREPFITKLNGTKYIIFDVGGEPLPSFPIGPYPTANDE